MAIIKPKITLDPKKYSMNDLGEILAENINRMQAGEIHFAMGKEINNAVGKIIDTAKAQIEYAAVRRRNPDLTVASIERARLQNTAEFGEPKKPTA